MLPQLLLESLFGGSFFRSPDSLDSIHMFSIKIILTQMSIWQLLLLLLKGPCILKGPLAKGASDIESHNKCPDTPPVYLDTCFLFQIFTQFQHQLTRRIFQPNNAGFKEGVIPLCMPTSCSANLFCWKKDMGLWFENKLSLLCHGSVYYI